MPTYRITSPDGVFDITADTEDQAYQAARAEGIIQDKPAALQAVQAARGQLTPEQMAKGREFLTETLPTTFEAGGQAIGGYLGGPLGVLTGGVIGSGVGDIARQGMRNIIRTPEGGTLQQGFDPRKTFEEMAWSLGPEIIESGARWLGRGMIRSTPGAQRIRFQEAARRARQLPEQLFDPPTEREVSRAFQSVRDSGIKIDTSLIQDELQIRGATPGKLQEIFGEMRRIDRANKTGGRYERLMRDLANDNPRTVGYDIGELQNIRSQLRKRREKLEFGTGEAPQLLKDLQDAVDDAIDQGIARGRVPAGQTPELLQQARRDYARFRSAEDMAQLIENKITSTPDLGMVQFNLRAYADEIRRGQTKLAQQANRALRYVPQGHARYQQAIDNIADLYQTIEFPLTNVSGFQRNWIIAGLGQMLSSIMMTTRGQQVFEEAVLQGRGRMSPNALALAFNAAMRELRGESSPGEAAISQPSESPTPQQVPTPMP